MQYQYIKDTYNVPAKTGGRVTFQGQLGTIKGARGAQLRIQLDGEDTQKLCHPVWEMEYLDA